MSRVVVEVTKWPAGYSLDIGDGEGGICVAGVHGGGVGNVVKSFSVDADRLIETIKHYSHKETE